MSLIQEIEERDHDNACFFARSDRFAGFDRGDLGRDPRLDNDDDERAFQAGEFGPDDGSASDSADTYSDEIDF